MNRLRLRLIALGACVALGGAQNGIAGVDFWQSFESFNLGPGGGQQGWSGAFQIVNTGIPGLGQRTARSAAGAPGAGQFDIVSPIFTVEPGTIQADIIINNNSSLFQFLTVNTLAGEGFFNTRLNFEATGSIRALQIVGQPPCATGTFADTTGTWTPGVKMRIGIEVLPGNVLRIYKDDVQIFQGHDIAQFCAAGDPDIGINQVRSFNSNLGTTAQMHVDNISSFSAKSCETLLPPCSADIQVANGVVDINDLLQIISDWGATGPPRPRADCAPPPMGDCQVDVVDMLAVLSQWGPCPE